MKPSALVALLALAVATGAVVVGHGIVLSEIDAAGLLDENLARAIAAPIDLRLWSVLVVACLVLAVAVHRWIAARVPTAISILLVGASGAGRFFIAPRAHEAWSRVDAVAGRPVEALARAQLLAEVEAGLTVAIFGLLVALVVLTVRHLERPARAT